MYRLLNIAFVILTFNQVFFHKITAQPQSKVQLAYQYFQSKEYQKAFVEFEGLNKNN